MDWSPAHSEKTPSGADIAALLTSQRVLIDEERIAEACQRLGTHHCLTGFTIALGQPPQPGRDGQIEWLLPLEKEGIQPGVVDSHDHINWHERQQFAAVVQGQLIGRWTPPTQGVSGIDVLGESIPTTIGRDQRISAGKNVQLSPDGTECFASGNGHALVLGSKVSVDALHRVSGNVDLHGGNIRFPGDVEITGDVMPGFVVEAEGNVVIGGVVDRAEVRALGHVVVQRGILNKSRVVAGGDLRARFLHEAYVECVGELVVADAITQSTVGGSHSVVITGRSGTRGIIGGKVIAQNDLVTYGLGSKLAIKTTVLAGNSSTLLLRRTRLQGQIAQADAQLQQLRHFIALGEADGSPERRGGLEKVKSALGGHEAKLVELRAQLAAVTAEITEPATAKVSVYGTAFENATIVIGERRLEVRDAVERVRFQIDPETGTITTSPLGR